MEAVRMQKPFRWKNCFADIQSAGYGEMAQAYLRDVVDPSITALEGRIAELSKRDDPVAMFSHGPAEELLRATLMAYCLSIQSLWEKQIRTYLQGCDRELRDGKSLERVQRADWRDLDAIFQDLRGVPLTAFEEYADLNLLQLLGNVCRHGDGRSLLRLAKSHPDLWPKSDAELNPSPPGSRTGATLAAETLSVSRDLLARFTNAIDSFWRETEYIYKESIERKHASLETRLIEERRMRAGRGRPWDPAG